MMKSLGSTNVVVNHIMIKVISPYFTIKNSEISRFYLILVKNLPS